MAPADVQLRGATRMTGRTLLQASGWMRAEIDAPDAALTVEERTTGITDVVGAQAGNGAHKRHGRNHGSA